MIKGNLMKGYKAQPCSAVGCSCRGSWAAFAATGLSLGPPTSGKCADLLETMDVFSRAFLALSASAFASALEDLVCLGWGSILNKWK